MRILFILDSVENPTSANVLMAQRLAGVLCAAGHTVHLLELWDGLHPQPELPGCTVHCLAFADERLMNAALENGRSGGSPIPVRLARLCCHPTAVAAAFRQLVLHAHFTVNGRKVNIPSYLVKAGDVIEVAESSRSSEVFKRLMGQDAPVFLVPTWMERDKNSLKGTVVRLPAREEIDVPVEEHLIVELYSK